MHQTRLPLIAVAVLIILSAPLLSASAGSSATASAVAVAPQVIPPIRGAADACPPPLAIGQSERLRVGTLRLPAASQEPSYTVAHSRANATPTPETATIGEGDIPIGTPDQAVHLLFFHDRLCEECIVVEEDVLALLKETYGPRLVIHRRDVEGSIESYNLLRELERHYGVTHAEMPVIFVGAHAIAGEQEARDNLPELVGMYADSGGAPLPDAILTPTPEAAATPNADVPPIHLAYFHQPGCRECDRVQLDLDHLERRYPQLTVHSFDVQDSAPLCEWLGRRAGVPEKRRLATPAAFAGQEALVGADLSTAALEAMVARHVDTGAEPVWQGKTSGWSGAASDIVERFRSFSLATVLTAGLLDGLNPCAFATLVFFISYLAFTGREGRTLLLAGATFALSVFLTYLSVGLGVLRFLATLPALDAASRWIYGLTAVLCLVLALGSLHDWWQAHRGRATEMRLKMPTRLRRWVNATIREGAAARAFLPVTFVTGVLVSVMELACTGQVYLPTILFVLGKPDLRVRAGLYLVLYNLMFIVPLVVVFVLAYYGTTSRQLGLLIHRHTPKVKLATAALFLLLTGWLVMTLIQTIA